MPLKASSGDAVGAAAWAVAANIPAKAMARIQGDMQETVDGETPIIAFPGHSSPA